MRSLSIATSSLALKAQLIIMRGSYKCALHRVSTRLEVMGLADIFFHSQCRTARCGAAGSASVSARSIAQRHGVIECEPTW